MMISDGLTTLQTLIDSWQRANGSRWRRWIFNLLMGLLEVILLTLGRCSKSIQGQTMGEKYVAFRSIDEVQHTNEDCWFITVCGWRHWSSFAWKRCFECDCFVLDAIWQWKDDRGSFHSYNSECQDLLENAYRHGKSSLNFTVSKRDYTVDLVSMTQTRKGFGTKRTVIRNPCSEYLLTYLQCLNGVQSWS